MRDLRDGDEAEVYDLVMMATVVILIVIVYHTYTYIYIYTYIEREI